jgi:hypothetical protein
MLNKLDEFPIHQTAEPIAQPATSDRNAYDRTWFNGFSADGSYYFGAGMAIYPHRGVLDCAFSTVTPGGRQHCFFASRRAPLERTEMQAGPFRIEVPEPMRRTRIILEDNASGLACDLEFQALSGGVEEARQTLWAGPRRIMDATRFDLFGRWSGWVRTPDGEIKVEAAVCHGMKDRSWGFRGFGEPQPWTPPAQRGGTFFLWVPLIWDDHISHAIFFDDEQGRPLVREALVSPLYAEPSAIPPVEESQVKRLATARHRVRYNPGTRWASGAELDLIDHEGSVRTIRLEPLLRFQMKGIGYGHPQWGHAMWKGELAIGHESFDPLELNPADHSNLHTQQVVRVTDGIRQGAGVLEQICFGPYAPAGFTEALDLAKG